MVISETTNAAMENVLMIILSVLMVILIAERIYANYRIWFPKKTITLKFKQDKIPTKIKLTHDKFAKIRKKAMGDRTITEMWDDFDALFKGFDELFENDDEAKKFKQKIHEKPKTKTDKPNLKLVIDNSKRE